MTYEAGGKIEAVLDEHDAVNLNNRLGACIRLEQITSYTPPPKPTPIVVWEYWDDDGLKLMRGVQSKLEWHHINKLTLNPNGTWTKEIVK